MDASSNYWLQPTDPDLPDPNEIKTPEHARADFPPLFDFKDTKETQTINNDNNNNNDNNKMAKLIGIMAVCTLCISFLTLFWYDTVYDYIPFLIVISIFIMVVGYLFL